MKFVNLLEYESAAKAKLSDMAYQYYAGGAADGVTVRENRLAFDRIQIYPHTLVDVSQRDTSTEVFKQNLSMPVIIAPMAMAKLGHPEGEIAIANAAKAAGVTMCLSTVSTTSVEDVAQTGANLWFQLYVYKDRGLTQSFVERAEAAGCKALVVTVDVPVPAYRDNLIRQPLKLPEGLELVNFTRYWDSTKYATVNEFVSAQFDASLTWQDVEKFAMMTSLPIILKGILRKDDAKRARDYGASGIVVSNHGGRQLDTTPAAIDVLPNIAEVVVDELTLLMDGGVRRGTDILKALARGAKAVLVGRPIFYALSVGGESEVLNALNILRTEYDIALALAGVPSSREVISDILRE